jgi:hypothetical protein
MAIVAGRAHDRRVSPGTRAEPLVLKFTIALRNLGSFARPHFSGIIGSAFAFLQGS